MRCLKQVAMKGIEVNDANWMNLFVETKLDEMFFVTIKDAWLEFEIATPNIPPSLPLLQIMLSTEDTKQQAVKKLCFLALEQIQTESTL